MPTSPPRARWRALSTLILLMAPLWAAPPGAAWGAEELTLDQAVQAALAGNARLAATQARAAALDEVPVRAGALPDPALRLNAMNLPVDSFALDREPMTQVQIGIAQAIPFPGKRPLRAEVAQRAAAVAEAEREELRREVARDVTTTWWRLFQLDRALEIVAANQELLRQFVTIARTKYTVGKGLQQDVLLAEVELSRMLDMRLELAGERAEAMARLNRLMGRTDGADAALPVSADVGLPVMPGVEELLARAGRERPLLRGARGEMGMAGAELDLARREHLPDFMVSADYGITSGRNPDGSGRPDFASLMVSLDLPIDRGSRQDRLVAQRTRELEAAQAAERAAHNRVREEIAAAHATYETTRERARLLQTGIIPQARQSVASMRAGYQVNSVDFLNLVRAQVTLYDYETRYWQALAAAKGALARLEAAVGGPVTASGEESSK